MSEIVARVAATDKTLAAYIDASFAWGRRDCARMVAKHLRHMGHKVSLIKAGSYASERAAHVALARAGYTRLEEALDERFERIPAASTLVGDIIALPSVGSLAALAVRLSNGRAIHIISGNVFGVTQPLQFEAAWRVPCLTKVIAGGLR